MNPYWSWLLTAVGATGLYIAGRRNWAGWAIGLGAQLLWITYAIATRQWGFVASAFVYGAVYAKNLRAWRKPKHPAHTCKTVPCPDCPDCRTGTKPHAHIPPGPPTPLTGALREASRVGWHEGEYKHERIHVEGTDEREKELRAEGRREAARRLGILEGSHVWRLMTSD